MYVPSKLTTTEWAYVESVNKDYAQWRRDHPDGTEYAIQTIDISALLTIISRLSKGEITDCEGCALRDSWSKETYSECDICKRRKQDYYQPEKEKDK